MLYCDVLCSVNQNYNRSHSGNTTLFDVFGRAMFRDCGSSWVFPYSYYLRINLVTIICYRISCKDVISCDVQRVEHVQSHIDVVTHSDLSNIESSNLIMFALIDV